MVTRPAACGRGDTDSDSGGNPGAVTGHATEEGREVATSRGATPEDRKANDRREVLSTVDRVLDDPSLDAHDIDGFKRDVRELAEALARRKGGAPAPGASRLLTGAGRCEKRACAGAGEAEKKRNTAAS